MGRTANARRNVITGLLNKLLMMLLAFASRTIFIRLLGAEYTGVSSLYTNILSVLSLAELGLGNVLMFYLYSALSDNDETKINQLVFEFKKIYTIIIIAVLSIGVGLVPLLKYIVHSDLDRNELVVYYLLYLLNSVASYAVVYRTTVLSADQKNYINNIVSTIMFVVMYIAQIVYLLLFKRFLGYLCIQVLCTILTNIILNRITIIKYPYLKKPIHGDKHIIDSRHLLGNIKATFLYKTAETLLDQTDSVLISMLMGTVYVGYYTNYYMLVTYLVSTAAILASGVVASFGNLVAEGNQEKSYGMFKVSSLMFSIIGTVFVCCYCSIVQDFIPLWIGSQYVMSYDLVISIMLVFYLRMSMNTLWIYRSAMGLFKEVQYANIFAALINIVLSIVLGRIIGLSGIIIATAISRLLTSFWYEGKVVFNKFNRSVKEYYLQQLKDFLICVLSLILTLIACKYVRMAGPIAIVCKLLVALSISISIEWLIYYRTKEFKKLVDSIFINRLNDDK